MKTTPLSKDVEGYAVSSNICNMGSSDIRSHPLFVMPYQEFLRAVGGMCKDQAFWLPLLYDAYGGTAIINDDTRGQVCEAMASHFSTVYVLGRDFDELACLRRDIQKRRLSNVIPVLFDPLGSWPFAMGSVDCVALQRLSMRRGQPRERRDYRSMLRAIDDILAPGGMLLITQNNPLDYTAIKPSPPMDDSLDADNIPMSYATVEKCMRSMDYHLNGYYGKFRFTRTQAPMPEFINMNETLGPEQLQISLLTRIKYRILEMRRVRRLWPCYMAVARKEPREGFVENLFQEIACISGAPVGGRGADGQPVVRKFIVGNSSVTIFIVRSAGRDRREFVIRIASREEGRQTIRRNTHALRHLAGTSISDLVPRIVHFDDTDAMTTSVEQKIKGLHLKLNAMHTDRYVKNAVERFLSWQREYARKTVLHGQVYSRLVESDVERLAEFCTLAERRDLDVIVGFIESALKGKELILGPSHGDFKLGNMLFDRNADIRGFIDWEMFDPVGLPLVDHYLLVTDRTAQEQRKHMFDAFGGHLLIGQLRSFHRSLLGDVTRTFNIDSAQADALKAVFWIRYINRQLRLPYKAHRTVSNDWITQPLSLIRQYFESVAA